MTKLDKAPDLQQLIQLNDAQLDAEFSSWGDDESAFERLAAVTEAAVWSSIRLIQAASRAWKRMKQLATAKGYAVAMTPHAGFFDRIAEGRTDAEVLFRLFSSSIREPLAAKVLDMPLEAQRKLVVEKSPILVAEKDGNDHRQLDIFTIPRQLENLALTRQGPRPLGEQKAILAHDSPRLSRPDEVDLESFLARQRQVIEQMKDATGKRERKRLAQENRELADKIILIVQ